MFNISPSDILLQSVEEQVSNWIQAPNNDVYKYQWLICDHHMLDPQKFWAHLERVLQFVSAIRPFLICYKSYFTNNFGIRGKLHWPWCRQSYEDNENLLTLFEALNTILTFVEIASSLTTGLCVKYWIIFHRCYHKSRRNWFSDSSS